MSLERAQDLRNSFNDGEFDEDIRPYFNDLITFFKFMKKYNLLEELDLREIPPDDFSNELFDYLVENAKEAQRMGENGRRAVENRYNWGQEEKKFLQFYGQILQS